MTPQGCSSRDHTYFVGVDCGTQGVRAGVFDERGTPLALAKKAYSYTVLPGGGAEQDAEVVLESMMAAVREAVLHSGLDAGRIAALGLDATAVTLVAATEDGEALAPAILWMDSRATSEADFVNSLSPEALYYTGGQVSPEWAIPKVMWLKANRPALYGKADRLVDLVDWLGFRLTGTWSATLSNLVSEWSYVPKDGGWSADLLDAINLKDFPAKVPERVVPMAGSFGSLRPAAASVLGLRSGTPIITAGMDSFAAGVGMGVTKKGRAVFSLGSSSCYLVQSSEPVQPKGLFGPMPGPIEKKKWLIQGGQTSAASLLNWFADTFLSAEEKTPWYEKKVSVFQWLDEEASAIPPGCCGLVAVDAFQGNRTPLREPRMSGALVGLTLSHNKTHIYRALMESVACGGRMIIEAFREGGIPIQEIYVCGGGASSRLWLQIHADITGLRFVKTEVQEAAALGSSMCASVGVGFHASLEESRLKMVRDGTAFEPDPSCRDVYADVYKKYRAACDLMLRSASVKKKTSSGSAYREGAGGEC